MVFRARLAKGGLTMKPECQLNNYERMWTTHADKYILVRLQNGDDDDFVIIRLPNLPVRIEDDETYVAVVQKMKESGVEIVDSEEMKRRRGRK
jgi:hypothetical protein